MSVSPVSFCQRGQATALMKPRILKNIQWGRGGEDNTPTLLFLTSAPTFYWYLQKGSITVGSRWKTLLTSWHHNVRNSLWWGEAQGEGQVRYHPCVCVCNLNIRILGVIPSCLWCHRHACRPRPFESDLHRETHIWSQVNMSTWCRSNVIKQFADCWWIYLNMFEHKKA